MALSAAERSAAWRKRHPEQSRAAARRYRAANVELMRSRCRMWSRANRDNERVRSAAYRARKLRQFIENVDPQECFKMHGGMCGICKGFIVGDFHVDHRIPLSKGGMHGYVNCQPAHPICNWRKGANVEA